MQFLFNTFGINQATGERFKNKLTSKRFGRNDFQNARKDYKHNVVIQMQNKIGAFTNLFLVKLYIIIQLSYMHFSFQ